jgi:hypothetical protein
MEFLYKKTVSKWIYLMKPTNLQKKNFKNKKSLMICTNKY